jgi:hypothetical protein
MVDFNQALGYGDAIRRCHELDEQGLYSRNHCAVAAGRRRRLTRTASSSTRRRPPVRPRTVGHPNGDEPGSHPPVRGIGQRGRRQPDSLTYMVTKQETPGIGLPGLAQSAWP